jgi:iron complex outermembrane receptor protein
MTRRKSPASATVLLVLADWQSAAVAQERALEEVIVTAQKREQNLQDVPVAVTAVSAETIEALGLVETVDITRVSASLTFGGGDSKQNTGFRIRGIGTSVFSIGVEPSVAVVIDEVSQVQPGQALQNLIDVERIEVLRGPQSTLFGKNASAGLLSVVTRAPSDTAEGFGELTVTDDDEQKVSGSVSGPLADGLAYRITGYYQDYDGWAENLYTGEDINGSDGWGGRAKLAWSALQNLDLTVTAYYADEDSTCCGLAHRELDPEARLAAAVPVTESNPQTLQQLSDNNRDPEIDRLSDSDTEDKGGSLKFDWRAGDFLLTSITGYNRWEYDNVMDVDFSPWPVTEFYSQGEVPGGIVSVSHVETEFFSQELRLTSPAGERFEYLLGLYYADADTDRDFNRTTPADSSWVADAGTESYAAFGQLTWHLFERTQLTLGGRYNNEEISVDFDDQFIGERYSQNDSEDKWLGKLALQYFLDDDTMVFASAANGYKGQAYDIATGFNQDKADNPIASEDSDSFEIGLKSTLLDQRLQLNLVAFYTEYDDYQAQNSEVVNDQLELTVDNVGSLESKGLELDAVGLVGDNLTLNASIAWIDATIDEYPNAECYNSQTEAQGCMETSPGSGIFVQDLAGENLNNSPDLKFTLGARYLVPLETLPFDGFVNFSYLWQDDVIFDLKQDPGTEQDSYGLLNASIGIAESERERYRVSLFVNNLFDEDYTAVIVDLSDLYLGDTAYIQLLPRDAERYVGMRFRYAF